jgi:hypothetical protein
MKQYERITKRGIIGTILIGLLILALAGTVTAADPNGATLNGNANRTPPAAYYHNATTNSSAWGHGSMMRGFVQNGIPRGVHPGLAGYAGMAHGPGIIHTMLICFGALLALLLVLVWLIVGILLILLLLRKLKKEKTP